MSKTTKLILLLLIFLIIPLVYAEEEEEEKCGITNLATCIPQKLYEYTLSIINAPLQPFLDMIKDFLSEAVNINPFSSLWAIIIYIISMFYGLFLHFIPPLKSYGKLVINFLLVIIFLPFIQSFILLAASKLVEISVFENIKIVVMMTAFTLVNLTMIGLALFVMIKAAMPVVRNFTSTVKTIEAVA